MNVNLRFFTLALGVAIAHSYSGLIILLGVYSATKVTPLAILNHLPFSSPMWIGITLIAASLTATFAFIGKSSIGKTLLLIAPQQLLLLASFLTVAVSVYNGTYPDGYEPAGGGLFISVDQIWLTVFCFWHTIEYGAIFTQQDRMSL